MSTYMGIQTTTQVDGGLDGLLRDPYEVRAWLRTFAPDTIVGVVASASNCTLHRFLSHLGFNVRVGSQHYVVEEQAYQSPAWAVRFIVTHDNLNDAKPYSPVTAGQALDCLAFALGEREPQTDQERLCREVIVGGVMHTSTWELPNVEFVLV